MTPYPESNSPSLIERAYTGVCAELSSRRLIGSLTVPYGGRERRTWNGRKTHTSAEYSAIVIRIPTCFDSRTGLYNQKGNGSSMERNLRYDVLFEPARIGPVIAPNRFYQVPHASGMTNALPHVRARFREMKAEGGWGGVCTGAVSIHPSSADAPLPFATLWDENDVRSHALTVDAVHRHGSLAGIELWHGGASVMNRASRLPPLSPSGVPWMATHVGFMGNQRPRAMDERDIGSLFAWQAEGARKARRAGFDIVYVYAGMGYLPYEFLLPEYNRRTDAYGGPDESL